MPPQQNNYRKLPPPQKKQKRFPIKRKTLSNHEATQFASKFDARYDVGHWIEVYYNRRRIHSTTGMIPADAMRQFRQRLDRAAIEIAA